MLFDHFLLTDPAGCHPHFPTLHAAELKAGEGTESTRATPSVNRQFLAQTLSCQPANAQSLQDRKIAVPEKLFCEKSVFPPEIMAGSATTRRGGVKHLLPQFPLPLPAQFLRQWTKPLFVNHFTPLQRWGQKQQCLLDVGSQPDKVQHLSYAGLGNMRAFRQFVETLQFTLIKRISVTNRQGHQA